MTSAAKSWYVYIVTCGDQTFYTGITTDVPRRLQEHNSAGKGARYTRGRRPVRLVYTECFPTRSMATKREGEIKRMPAGKKRQLITSRELEIPLQ